MELLALQDLLESLDNCSNRDDFILEIRNDRAKVLLDYITRLKRIADERMQVILKIEQYLINNGVDDETLKICDIYDINGIELKKYIDKIKGE
ncbi:MAG: hypothetical protein IKN65_00980 [Clostridia bacterium]|nr:hypothetical protein [Bacilli bacterium]MBR3672858.1 hypothetical protein [Clostridia bacterium]